RKTPAFLWQIQKERRVTRASARRRTVSDRGLAEEDSFARVDHNSRREGHPQKKRTSAHILEAPCRVPRPFSRCRCGPASPRGVVERGRFAGCQSYCTGEKSAGLWPARATDSRRASADREQLDLEHQGRVGRDDRRVPV